MRKVSQELNLETNKGSFEQFSRLMEKEKKQHIFRTILKTAKFEWGSRKTGSCYCPAQNELKYTTEFA